jgi:hypothetical protein
MVKYDYLVARVDGDYGAGFAESLAKPLQTAGAAGFDLVHTNVHVMSNDRVQYTCILKRTREEPQGE